MRWGKCPVCHAPHGEPCDSRVGIPLGRNVYGEVPTEGAHLGRLRNAPKRVRGGAGVSDTLDPRQRRVLRAAERFAAFQEPDSLADQRTDHALRREAAEALEELLEAVAAAPCATCDGRGGRFDDGTEYCACDF